MMLFFFVALPLMSLAFVLYAYALFKDLRSHGVL